MENSFLFAYLDPFTGSMVLQVLAMFVVGVAAFFRPIWYFITGKKPMPQNADTESTEDSEKVEENDSENNK